MYKADRYALVMALRRKWVTRAQVHLDHGYHPKITESLFFLVTYQKVVKGWGLDLEPLLLRNEEYPSWYRVWTNRDGEEIREGVQSPREESE
jgi:hypothetical protein